MARIYAIGMLRTYTSNLHLVPKTLAPLAPLSPTLCPSRSRSTLALVALLYSLVTTTAIHPLAHPSFTSVHHGLTFIQVVPIRERS